MPSSAFRRPDVIVDHGRSMIEYIAQTLQTWVPIKYCPWCGVELGRFYRKTWEALYDESELSAFERRAN